MKQTRYYLVCGLFILIAAACTAGPITQPGVTTGSTANTTGPARTATIRPTVTLNPTASTIPTVEPMVTPSPGPAPDLEIFNVTFPPSLHSTAFLGEMRNNTDQPVIFPARITALRLGIEQWTTYGGVYYSHYQFDAYVKPYVDDKRMNCVIYPHETGIIAFDFNICSTKENCVGEGEQLSTPPSQIGNRLIYYESYPKGWEEYLQFPYIKTYYPSVLDKGYHLQVDNLTYESQVIEEQMDWGVMFFEFDVAFYIPDYQRGAHTPIWIILYDKEGRIVNVMRNSWVDINQGYGDAISGDTYHISGAACNNSYCLWEDWKKTNPRMQWFEPIAKLTIEGMNSVDHIRILAENQDPSVCHHPDFERK